MFLLVFQWYFYGGAVEEDTSVAARLRNLLAGKAADQAVSLVASRPPGRCSAAEVLDQFGPELTDGLLLSGVVRREADALWLNCPVFLAEDLGPLRQITGQGAEDIAAALSARRPQMDRLLSGLSNGFSPAVNLYHLLCGCVFDGLYFEELEAEGLISTGRDCPEGLSDLVILYEADPPLDQWSRSLLCSYNRYGTKAGTFQSFGDCAGDRWDLYRTARRLETGELEDSSLLPLPREALVEAYISLLKGGQPGGEALACFERFGYARAGRPCVPIYVWEEDRPILDELFRLTLDATAARVRSVLSHLGGCVSLTANRHRVPLRDTANEVYHLLFGQVNGYLVQQGIVAPPEDYGPQGRYRKAFELHRGTVPRLP